MTLLKAEIVSDHLDNEDIGGEYLYFQWYIGYVEHNTRKVEISTPEINEILILTFTADTSFNDIEFSVKTFIDLMIQKGTLHMDYKLKKNDNKATLYLSKKRKDVKTCSICQDDIKYGQDIAIHKCNNIFHEDCIQTWLNQKLSNKCPLCRSFGRKRKSKKFK